MAITLMVQGTTSDAGKTTLVAALCRILKRKGISVVPFKPQNMALNSAVTVDGGEIGRAQALQAQAAGLPPHTDMNPVLLKPSSDTRAQIIIHGKVVSNMEADVYHDYKTHAMQAVLESYHRLASQYDVIVVEGAGSPAEINLRDRDIANMGFAEAVDCPVVIISDIDRGGVFAHLVGTLELLSESEQARVIGFVINRFRGDIGLLNPGLDWLEKKTGKPVLGVIPYLHGFYADAEDALTVSNPLEKSSIKLRVAALALPRISNHNDLDAFRLNPCVEFTWVGPNQSIPMVDLIVIPGSKNVRADIRFLKSQQWDLQIKKHLRYGGKVIGICGGYQMLGEAIHDPIGIEDEAGSELGLQLLPVETVLHKEKQLFECEGFLWDGITRFKGYEIHLGVTSHLNPQKPACLIEKCGECFADGVISNDNQILGTYVHGLFDSVGAVSLVAEWLGASLQDFDINRIRENELNRLADTVEQSCQFDFLWSN